MPVRSEWIACVNEIDAQIDEASRQLLGLTKEELKEIQEILEELS